MIANIDTDNAFCLRTPRLAISLRNGNIQQFLIQNYYMD